MNSRTLRLLFSIIVLVTAFLYMTKDTWQPEIQERFAKGSKHVAEIQPPPVTPPISDNGKVFGVLRIQVLKGNEFDIVLDNESRILAKLPVRVTEQSKSKIVDLFNHCENPRVKLISRMKDGQWLVDIKFAQAGKEVDLATWLSDNKLVYK